MSDFKLETRHVVVAEDHPLYRRGIVDTVNAVDGWRVVAETDAGGEVIRLVEQWNPDLLVLDLKLSGRSGWGVIDALRTSNLSPDILLLTSFRHPLVLTLARQAAAAALVSKEDPPDTLSQALQAVRAGKGFHASPGFLAVADTGMEAPSGRELEVLRNIAGGATGKEISDRLGLNAKTVETYRARLMRKLDCGNAADLTRIAVESGLV